MKYATRYGKVRGSNRVRLLKSRILRKQREAEPPDAELLLSQITVTATLLRQRERARRQLEEARG